MIKTLQARNFKSWKDTGALRLAPLTGLFGANSSGKSSIFQLLLMLKQTVESPDRKRVLHTGDERTYVDLGTFHDLIYGHDPLAELSVMLSWDLPETLTIRDPEERNKILYGLDSLGFHTIIQPQDEGVAVAKFEYSFGDTRFGMERREGSRAARRDEYNLIHAGFDARRNPGRGWPLPAPVKCYGFPDEAVGYYQNTGFLPEFVLAFERLFSSISYLGPLREYPKRTYVWGGDRPVDVGRRGEDAVAALLAAVAEGMTSPRLVRVRRRHLPVQELIGEWLSNMGLANAFDVRPIAENRKDYEVRMRRGADSAQVLITDVGFGVSQILPVLVLCYYVPENSTILLEHPEIHLHPSVQADLADLFIEVVKERNVQIIVESHSEHLLRRLQRRIAEERIDSSDTALYFCEFSEQASQARELEVDMFGNIRNWPQDFFGDELGDLVAAANAARQRSDGSA